MRTTCTAHFILHHLLTLTTYGEKYKHKTWRRFDIKWNHAPVLWNSLIKVLDPLFLLMQVRWLHSPLLCIHGEEQSVHHFSFPQNISLSNGIAVIFLILLPPSSFIHTLTSLYFRTYTFVPAKPATLHSSNYVLDCLQDIILSINISVHMAVLGINTWSVYDRDSEHIKEYLDKITAN